MMSQFIDLIRSQIDKGIYVWGGQGQVATEELIRKMESDPVNETRAINLLNKRKSEGVDPVLMFDCSGLIIWALQKLGLITYDTTAEGLRRLCKVTSTPKVGDFCFKSFSDGRANHVGIVTRPGYVTEAKGRDYGVIETPMIGWVQYGVNPFITKEVEEVLQKGDKGDQVTYWQRALLKAGYKLPLYGADSDFGGETETATKQFQTAVNLPITGIVNTITFATMCNVLQGITSDKAELDAAKLEIAKLRVDLNNEKTLFALTNDTLKAEQDRAQRLRDALIILKSY